MVEWMSTSLACGSACVQRHRDENTHRLALDADGAHVLEMARGGLECCLVAGFVAPVIDLALKSKGGEGGHFEIGNDGHGAMAMPCNHDERAFVLVKIGAEDAPEIGPGHQGYCVESAGAQDRVKHVEAGV